ncbi:hypothetical protein DSOUD_1899 [Desulfuromonas soudanensis]|uniref:Lipoprotein n=1 Tax=Desulfuromonas soudanensis TaxID=1603606 RepID=A0A0M4DID1_9BACT|nr:hypothetical protein [Desulfuromonas soudanensis]ALC16670.1 hypothetical protein DSOUD_1899 [Desulfuromonas soudanensis]
MVKLLAVVCASIVLGGCGIAIIPQATGTAKINSADNSLTETRDGISVTARVEDLEVAPYRTADNITSFNFVIENRSSREITLPLSSFVLVDDKGNQYRPMTVAEVGTAVARDSEYLIPYPYVGFYYLEDREKFSAFNTFNSSLPYYAENHPAETLTRALPAGPVLPHGRISGLLYFPVDLSQKRSFQLRIYRPETPSSGAADFTFPFSVEKK